MKKKIRLKNKTILVTGAAGFIGFYLTKRLLNDYKDVRVIGFDNLNDYYDISLKDYRLNKLKEYNNFTFIKGNIADKELLNKLFNEYKPSIVVNLAAQAGVRYSIDHPDIYIESNIIGFYNIIEACRNNDIEHFVFASSSSVYGENAKTPFSVEDKVDNPVSLYAATKKSDELLAYCYSKLYNIPTTGLRFFTVYGPMGRPDMSYYELTNKFINKETLHFFKRGECLRDFTYIDDIVEGLIRVIQGAPKGDIPYSLYNIGNSNPIDLLDYALILQEVLKNEGIIPNEYDYNDYNEVSTLPKGDVPITYADITELERDYGFKPNTTLKDGLTKFAKWFKEYYK